MYATLTMILKGLQKSHPDYLDCYPMFVCPILANLPGVQSATGEITPLLYDFVKRLAPELIVDCPNKAIMDRWLNYDAFFNFENESVRAMAKDLHMVSGSPNHIQNDNGFKVKFFTYLLERHGDVGFDIP